MHIPPPLWLLPLSAPLAHCWGVLGHSTVAYLAYKHLTPGTAAVLDDMLANEAGYDFGDAATWADAVRHARPYSGAWHYVDAIDNPPTQCGLTYPGPTCPPKTGCILSALANQTALFLSPRTPAPLRKEALFYMLHFLGDIHQPLHTEHTARGGNDIPVCFGPVGNGGDGGGGGGGGGGGNGSCAVAGERANLHSVWDTWIPRRIVGLGEHASRVDEKAAAAVWASRLYTRQVAGGVRAAGECARVRTPDECSVAWAQESNGYVCSYVFQPGLEWLLANDLSREYYDGAVGVVEGLVAKAGVRLAAWLEASVAGLERDRGRVGEQRLWGSLEL